MRSQKTCFKNCEGSYWTGDVLCWRGDVLCYGICKLLQCVAKSRPEFYFLATLSTAKRHCETTHGQQLVSLLGDKLLRKLYNVRNSAFMQKSLYRAIVFCAYYCQLAKYWYKCQLAGKAVLQLSQLGKLIPYQFLAGKTRFYTISWLGNWI